MALSKLRIESRLRPILLANLNPDIVDSLVEEDFLEIFNEVANDFNSTAMLLLKRFKLKTGEDTAEADSDKTNYLLEGVIEKILSFYYRDSGWQEQEYTFTQDRVALKSKPPDGVVMNIHYLIRPGQIQTDTDELGLPEMVETEYLALVKDRILSRYGQLEDKIYEDNLFSYSAKANRKLSKPTVRKSRGVSSYWFHQCGDETLYDITDNFISLGNFIENASGQLIYIE